MWKEFCSKIKFRSFIEDQEVALNLITLCEIPFCIFYNTVTILKQTFYQEMLKKIIIYYT